MSATLQGIGGILSLQAVLIPANLIQGKQLVDYLKQRGWKVHEVIRPDGLSDALKGAKIVIRFSSFVYVGEKSREVAAYRKYVERGGALLLFSGSESSDNIAATFGIRFDRQIIEQATIETWNEETVFQDISPMEIIRHKHCEGTAHEGRAGCLAR